MPTVFCAISIRCQQQLENRSRSVNESSSASNPNLAQQNRNYILSVYSLVPALIEPPHVRSGQARFCTIYIFRNKPTKSASSAECNVHLTLRAMFISHCVQCIHGIKCKILGIVRFDTLYSAFCIALVCGLISLGHMASVARCSLRSSALIRYTH